MEKAKVREIAAHCLMAFIGGFVALYSITACAGLFGAAQTGNVMNMVKDLFGGNLNGFLLRLAGFFIFAAAVVFTTVFSAHFSSLKPVCVDAAAFIGLGFIPDTVSPIVRLYPIIFAMTVQWNSFRGTKKCFSSTPFTTNNLRQCVIALVQSCSRDRQQRRTNLLRALFYVGVIACFIAGICILYLLWGVFGAQSIWFALIPAAAAFPFTLERRPHASQPDAGFAAQSASGSAAPQSK